MGKHNKDSAPISSNHELCDDLNHRKIEISMNLHHLGIVSIITYISIALLQGLQLFGKLSYSQKIYFFGSLIAVSSQGWVLYKVIDTPLGQNLDWFVMLCFSAWLMNLITLIMSLRAQIANLCVLTYPLAALLLAMALSRQPEVINNMQGLFLTHILISLSAMSFLSLASFQALLMGLQNFLIKHHRPSPLLRLLAPLQSMETLLFTIIWGGMLLLSASLVSGFFYQADHLTSYLFPKTMLAILAWILLTLLIVGRTFFGWRGPTAIRWTLSSTIFAVLSYFGTKALLF
ncbi:MAG: cytochrome c biogenesis protein CcsA [Proteobacteria bacterium]|nr:cytochrome c biogenesis protein CcsA [Pseudomonadota bacterium]